MKKSKCHRASTAFCAQHPKNQNSQTPTHSKKSKCHRASTAFCAQHPKNQRSQTPTHSKKLKCHRASTAFCAQHPKNQRSQTPTHSKKLKCHRASTAFCAQHHKNQNSQTPTHSKKSKCHRASTAFCAQHPKNQNSQTPTHSKKSKCHRAGTASSTRSQTPTHSKKSKCHRASTAFCAQHPKCFHSSRFSPPTNPNLLKASSSIHPSFSVHDPVFMPFTRMRSEGAVYARHSVSTLWGSHGNLRSGVFEVSSSCAWDSSAQARTEFRLRRQSRKKSCARDVWWFYRVSVYVLKQNGVLRDRRERSEGFGASKRGFLWNCVRFQASCWFFASVSWKTLVLEIWSVVFCMRLVQNTRSNFNFCESLVRFARFGAPDSPFSWKSRIKRSFWSSGFSVFVEVSHKTLVLELRIVRFLKVSHKTLVLELRIVRFLKVSHKTLVLELRIVRFLKVSHKTLVLELRIFSFWGSLAHNARFGSPDLQWSTRILKQRCCTRVLIQRVENGVIQRSSDILPYRILIQWSKRVLIQRPRRGSWHRDVETKMLYKGPTGSWHKWLKERVLKQRCCTRILQDPDKRVEKIRTQRSWYRSKILGSYRDPDILPDRILIQWSKGSWYSGPEEDPHIEILKQRSCNKWSYKILIKGLKNSSYRDSDTEILYKWSYSILF